MGKPTWSYQTSATYGQYASSIFGWAVKSFVAGFILGVIVCVKVMQ